MASPPIPPAIPDTKKTVGRTTFPNDLAEGQRYHDGAFPPTADQAQVSGKAMTLGLSGPSWNAGAPCVPAQCIGHHHDSFSTALNPLAEFEVFHSVPEGRVHSLRTA